MEGNELKRTASESDEKNPSLEKLQIPTHFEICKFIREICLKVKAHPKVTATALLVYHRIYDYDQMATFEELDPYLVASSSIWIATKGCEELQLRLRDVVNVVYRALNPDAKPLALDDSYYDLRDSITTVELLLLRILQFQIPAPHFFDYLTKFLYSMERWCHGRVNPNNQEQVKLFQAVSRTAVTLMMDGLHRPTYLRYDDPSVALACLDMSVKVHNLVIPLDDFGQKSWRKAIYSNADWPTIKEIQDEIMKVYEVDELNYSLAER